MTVALRHVASFLWGQGLGLSLFLLALVTRPLVAEHPWLTQPVIEWLAFGTLVVSAAIAAFFTAGGCVRCSLWPPPAIG